MPTKLLKITRLLCAGLLILLFDASAQQTLLAQPQPETCDPDASVTVLLRDPDNFESYLSYPHISDDGRYVAYTFHNQISGEWVNIPYRYDRVTCTTEIISITGDATPYMADQTWSTVWSLSGDGRFVVFEFVTTDTTLSGIYIQDMATGTVEKIPDEDAAFVASISRDGRYVLYTVYDRIPAGPSGYPSEQTSLFLYDRDTRESELIYAAEEGLFSVIFLGSIAGDNSRIAFSTNANLIDPDENIYTLTDVFVYDRGSQELNRITTGSNGSPSFGALYTAAISANGRYVVYSAWVETADNNGSRDVFVYDELTNTTRQISVAADGSQGNGPSGHEFVSISADGRFIAFSSDATNLIVGETHDTRGVYIYDQLTDHLWRVGVDDYYPEGTVSGRDPMLSRDGQWLAYATGGDLFIVEWQTLIEGGIEEPTPLPGVLQPETCDPDASVNVLLRNPENLPQQGYLPFISDDGRYIAYTSAILISGSLRQVPYRYDRVTCTTEIISITGDATPYTADHTWAVVWGLSGDGRYALFGSSINMALTELYVQDMDTGTVEKIPAENAAFFTAISRDGRFVLYSVHVPTTSGIPDNRARLYLYDRDTGESELIFASEEGAEDVSFFGSISADNNRIVFNSNANQPNGIYDRTDVFVYDRGTQALNLITTGSDGSPSFASEFPPTISANGRYVVYPSREDNLDSGDPYPQRSDIFVYDHQTNITRRILPAANGVQSNGGVGYEHLSISADGRYITFASNSPNLIAGETHNTHSVYIYDQLMDDLWRVSVEDYYVEGIIADYNPVLSRDGQWLAYETRQETDHFATDLFIVEWQTLIDGEIEEPTPSAPDAYPDRNVKISGESLLTWGAITWAVGYEIQIDDDANFSSLVASDNALTDTYLAVPDLPNGVFYWRVRAQRPNGSWSNWSAVDSFVVVTP